MFALQKYHLCEKSNKKIILKSESLTLGNFTKEDIKTLYLEHSKETGQIFEDEIWDLAWDYTAGQPMGNVNNMIG